MSRHRGPKRGAGSGAGSSGSHRGPSGGPRSTPGPRAPGQGAGSGFSLQPREPGCFELVHPPCVERVWDDYAEAIDAWKAGEPDEARDMLRFALEGCGDHLWIHCALGQIALEVERDPALARGHFGYALELAERALPQGFAGRLPPDLRGNRPVYQAIDGLVACARALSNAQDESELTRLRARLSGAAAPTRPKPPAEGTPE